MLNKPFYRKTTWLLLAIYLPLALFMGLQHRHSYLVGTLDTTGTDSKAEVTVELSFLKDQNSVAELDAYCPACHFYISHSLGSYLPVVHITRDGLHYTLTTLDDPNLPLTLLFSERAPPLFIA